MSDDIELTDRQVERIDSIRAELKEAEPGVPPPSREQIIDSLLDTWDAIGRGHYHSPGEPIDAYDDITEHTLWLTPFDMDHLRDRAPVFRGVGEHIALVIQAASWDELEQIRQAEDE